MRNYKKTARVNKFKLPIEIQKEGDYFIARCPIWSDCYAQGTTIDEATAEIVSVASSLIELYQEEDLKIPLVKLEGALAEFKKVRFDIPVFACK
jgi:predicted RNase H-like HicB family nuclease